MSEKTFETSLVSLVNRIPDLLSRRGESLEEYNAGLLHNEYLVVVEDRLQAVNYLPGILEKLQTRLAAQTATAISLMVGVPDLNVYDLLDTVKTRRSVLDAGARTGVRLVGAAIGESSRPSRFALPSYDNLAMAVGEATAPRHHSANNAHSAAFQNGVAAGKMQGSNVHLHDHNDRVDNSKTTINHYEGGGKKSAAISSTLGNSNSAIKQITEQEGLSTGKQFSIVIERNGNKAELMMSLRLSTQYAPSDMVRTILSFAEANKDFWDRLLRIKVGVLNGWRDGFLQNDIMDEYRKNRFRDTTGLYKKMVANKNRNWVSGVLTLSPSINNASTIMIISSDTADAIAPHIGGDLDDDDVRMNLFRNSLLSYIVVVDEVWGRVKIYTRSLFGYQTLEASEFGKTGKGGGAADVNRIIEAYRAGAQPSLG